MLSIHQLQVRAESLPLLKHGLRLLHVTWLFLSNILGLALKFILLFGLKLISLPVFQVEAPEIDLADIEYSCRRLSPPE
jgi:hypothetical protein